MGNPEEILPNSAPVLRNSMDGRWRVTADILRSSRLQINATLQEDMPLTGHIALFIITLDITWRLIVKLTLRPLYPPD
jgi:hypothetical protein